MSRVLFKILCKLVQRQTYSCLSTRYGIILCFGGILLFLISAFQFGEVALEWSMQKYSLNFNVYHDNVVGKSFQNRLCLPIPIDVVYTWVNGSDPILISRLQKLRLELEEQENRTRNEIFRNGSDVRDPEKLLKKAIVSNAKKRKSNEAVKANFDCSFANCAPGRILVLENVLKQRGLTLQEALSLHPSFKLVSVVRNSTLEGPEKEYISMLYFPNADTARNAMQESIKWNGQSIDSFQGYFTTNGSNAKSIRSEYEIVVTGFTKYTDLVQLQQALQENYGKSMIDISYEPSKHVAVVYFKDKHSTQRVLEQYKGNLTVDEGALKIHPAFLVWSNIFTQPSEQSTSGYEDSEENEISANRFADNQELKYSLRSIEKFAPWVRNVYIVTNGQIPSWLNLDNPRIKIISHKDIFKNHSHLPTFSSPAIESHIHRIPGLSQKFIYMNDDVMFGDDVWPDDFYTHAKGQKLYLTWPVPNCNDGCPANWISDKYCDKACNVSECDYDGGDCIGIKQGSRYSYQSWHHQQSRFRLDFCGTGCADTWVGDRYCDTACNVQACGFDSGDCGVSKFDMLYRLDIKENNQNFTLPSGLKEMYFNISHFFHDVKITEAEHTEEIIIRSAVVAQRHKILTLVLRTNYSRTPVSFRITGISETNHTKKVELNFNISVETTGTYVPTTAPPILMPNTKKILNPTLAVVTERSFKEIRILYANKPINYWSVINGSIPRPTWMVIDSSKYDIPHLSNDTVLPQEINKALQNLQEGFAEGDLTEKGYRRRKAKILREYLNNASHYGNHATTVHDNLKTMVISMSNDSSLFGEKNAKVKKRKGEYGDLETEVQSRRDGDSQDPRAPKKDQNFKRHLLSTDDAQEDLDSFAPGTIERSFEVFQGRKDKEETKPNEDELFLANWIADSKRKQLSYDEDMEKSYQKWKSRYGDWNPRARATDTSFLPWEKSHTFQRSAKREQRRQKREEYTFSTGYGGRKLLDTFADSLLHVHRIYNRKFGYIARKVPAHMPHMIDVKIMNELQEMFPEEFDMTSSHRLRSSDDMQFAFSYNYFVIGQPSLINVTELFMELDSDHSGHLSARELRTLAAKIYPLPLDSATMKKLEKTLINCSLDINKTPLELNEKTSASAVTESLLRSCAPILSLLNDTKKSSKKYKHETLGDDDIAFKMIGNNATAVLRQLDNIRANRKKFICLNDNIDHSQDATTVRALLVDFYESFFPIPSQFELPAGYRNQFLYVDELQGWKKQRQETDSRIRTFVAVLALALLVILFRRKFIGLVRCLNPFRRGFIPSVSESGSTRLMSV